MSSVRTLKGKIKALESELSGASVRAEGLLQLGTRLRKELDEAHSLRRRDREEATVSIRRLLHLVDGLSAEVAKRYFKHDSKIRFSTDNDERYGKLPYGEALFTDCVNAQMEDGAAGERRA